MTVYRPGDIILVPFPFTDLTTFKQRPAVIISSSKFNRARGDVIIAAITSHIEGKMAEDEYRLDKSEQHAAGLPLPSIIKLGKIVTLDQRLIRKTLGRLPKKTMNLIVSKIHKIIDDF